MGNSQRLKGNKFERQVCKILHAWAGGGPKDELIFRRRSVSIQPLEGHWDGRGDILHRPDFLFPFAIEAKKHESWNMEAAFEGEGWNVVADFWKQTMWQASEAKLAPLLVFSKNLSAIFCMMRQTEFTWLEKNRSGPKNAKPPDMLRLNLAEGLCVMKLEKLTTYIDYRALELMARRLLVWSGGS
jgi:hypothetical protein